MFDLVPELIVAFGGLAGLMWGVYTYSESQTIKRKDLLFPLIKEFDESKEMQLAKDILDDKPVTITEGEGADAISYTYHVSNIEDILRDHRVRSIDKTGEEMIRNSFDSLLDFFVKLDYLTEIKLLKKKEILYFQYYISKVADNPAITKYVTTYKFPLQGNLHEKLTPSL